MDDVREDFLAAAGAALELLRAPVVADAWDEPSALPEFSVGGLAGHMAFQVLAVVTAVDSPAAAEPLVGLLGHYERVRWMDAGMDAEINVRIREGGETLAKPGPAALAERLAWAVADLMARLPALPNEPVRLPIPGPWSLLLDDLLVTRMMELAVHMDDLAVSVRVATPTLPPRAVDTVIDLLARLAVRRHGPANVLRALSRAERAPASVAAF